MKINNEDKGRILKDPPQTLLLQKKVVQNFPNNQKVALYYCSALKKYFSLTYDKNGIELLETDFSIIDKLKTVEEVEPLHFHDGSELNIDKSCSEHIVKLYEELTEGKYEFEEYILSSDKNFLNILDYSVNKFKQET